MIDLIEGEVYRTLQKCDICGELKTMKQRVNWVTLKCRCRCVVIYPDWHFTPILKHERREKIQNGLQEMRF